MRTLGSRPKVVLLLGLIYFGNDLFAQSTYCDAIVILIMYMLLRVIYNACQLVLASTLMLKQV